MNVRHLAWPALIVSMLAANMTVVGITMVAARRDEGAAITPGYDQRALRWNEHRVALDDSRALGWRCDASVERDVRGSARLRLALRDAAGAPIRGAELAVECFHNAHPRGAVVARVRTDARGTASVELPDARPGLHTVRLDSPAAADRARFILELEVLVPPAPVTPPTVPPAVPPAAR